MLRPATPLTILLFISFILLLLSVLSTPIVKGIPLATFQGVSFGVFGFCKGDQCSGIRIGYTTDGLFGNSTTSDFSLSPSVRHSLSSLLIIHPVAAFFNLVCFTLAAAAHFHSPSHSARYLLGLLILLLPTLLVTLLAFLVDILLFVPRLQWGGWIVLVSTILITASGVVTCAMRRTLVSRKARKRRIAENAEMNGEDFYTRQNAEPKFMAPVSVSTESQPPMVNGAPGANKLPSFAAFDSGRRISDEEKRPLNQRAPPTRSQSIPLTDRREDGTDRYGPPRSRSHGRYDGPRDMYGNPLPPSNAFGPPLGPNAALTPSRPGDSYMNDRMGPPPRQPNRGGYGAPRGRGGYPPRGSYGPRGGYGNVRGPPPHGYNGRGGYPPRGRGGYSLGPVSAGAGLGAAAGAMMGRGGAPPPRYPIQDENMALGQQGPPMQEKVMPSTQNQIAGPEPTQYIAYAPGNQSLGVGLGNPPLRNQPPHSARQQSPAGGFRDPSPPPPLPGTSTGHAMEMDAPVNRLRESDSDVQGMVGLQQNRQAFAANGGDLHGGAIHHDPDEYRPPRADWPSNGRNIQQASGYGEPAGGRAHTTASPVELPTANSAVGSYKEPTNRSRVNSGGSDTYYEDVNPRFAPELPDPTPHTESSAALPRRVALAPDPNRLDAPIPHSASYDDLQQGGRSPAESETSNFTSVSQRGVNPHWRPGGPGDVGQYGPNSNIMRKPLQHQQRRDMLLGNNPDFELPIPRPSRGRGGMMRGGGSRPIGPPSSFSAGSSRYPGDV